MRELKDVIGSILAYIDSSKVEKETDNVANEMSIFRLKYLFTSVPAYPVFKWQAMDK